MEGAGTAEACGCAGFMNKSNHGGGGGSGGGGGGGGGVGGRKPSVEGGACPAAHAIPPLPQLGPPLILPTRTIYSFAVRQRLYLSRCRVVSCPEPVWANHRFTFGVLNQQLETI
jgi:hypothetical protein